MDKTYTKEEWDSRKITYGGFAAAMFDILLMGIYLLGGLTFLRASSIENTVLMWGYLSIGVFLMFNAIGKLFRLFNPRDWYEVEITKNEVDT
jgi:hypothetical protein